MIHNLEENILFGKSYPPCVPYDVGSSPSGVCSGMYVLIRVHIPSRAGQGLQCSAQSGTGRS